ncbi:HEAT repeat [Micromonospora pattaloongensis]|uniref:HEAT repeat n=1 Tax=Micromonospora pattaloongensis TaxID=405436 RepID=A0A1H3QFC3_9ACTN|nr:HEAT repeat domain-containing protein [Micromonospora pattaloongensis]SDZ11429.1 HEAT repeat [Micromonospora pattaloongensis]
MVGIATGALLVLTAVTVVLAAVIIFGRAARRIGDARRARLAAPARRALLALAAGDDEQANFTTLARLEPGVWRAVEPTAVALLGKVRGEARAVLVSVFEERGSGERALRQTRRAGAVRRARAAEVLGNLRRRDAVPTLVALLADPDPDVRAVTARALGRIADPTAVPALLASLVGPRPVPPQAVADAVLRIGADGRDALVGALDHPAELVRVTAVEVLGLVGAITAAGRVIEVLSGDASPAVRARAAVTLGRLGTRQSLGPLLTAVEPTQPPALRAAAARALGDLGAVAAAPALGTLLADPDHDVAHAAAYALLRMGDAGRAALARAAHAAPAGSDPPVETATARAGAYAREALAVAELEARRRVGAAAAAAVR